MSKQFEQLELLYKQVLALSNSLKVCIDKEDYDEAVSCEAYKAQIISKINMAEKTIKLSDEENDKINSLKSLIYRQEKENLERLQVLKGNILKELKAINSQNKLAQKYEQIEPNEGSICDYTSD